VEEVARRIEHKLAQGLDPVRAAGEAGRELAGEQLLAAFIELLHAYAAQMHGLLPRSMPEREAALSLGVGIERMLGSVMGRFQSGEGYSGKAAAAARLFYRLNGLSYWTDALKSSAGLMLSHNLAERAGTAFAELPRRMQATLRSYGINEAEATAA
jgi:hypothetical protein